VSFKKYLKEVHYKQDKILFSESLELAESGHYRSAYIMVWLSCAESIKRRFQESKGRDTKAQAYCNEIDTAEENHSAVDNILLKKAFEYGIISDAERLKLHHIFEDRCMYAHPYNQKPTVLELDLAITTVVDIILSKPNQFTKSYLKQLINSLATDKNYLFDSKKTVLAKVGEWIKEIHPSYYSYFIQAYWKTAENQKQRPDFNIFKNRARWIIKSLLKENGFDMFSANAWLDFVAKSPLMSIEILLDIDYWAEVDESVQDYLISKILDLVEDDNEYLNLLSPFLSEPALLGRHFDKVEEFINKLDLGAVARTEVKLLKIKFKSLIESLDSGTYAFQNEAIKLIKSREIEIAELTSEQQILLGKSLHGAAEWGEWSAGTYRDHIISNPQNYTLDFLKGITLLLLFKPSGIFDFNYRLLEKINTLIMNMVEVDRNSVKLFLEERLQEVKLGDRSQRYYIEEFQNIIESKSLRRFEWAQEIIKIAQNEYDELEEVSNDNTDT